MISAQATDQVQTRTNGVQNRLDPADRAFHDWFRFVLSYPPHLVRDYLNRFGASPGDLVLDPFCGTGTTLVECKKLGVPSVGIEAMPMAWFASTTKTSWDVSPEAVESIALAVKDRTLARLEKDGVPDDDFFDQSQGSRVALKCLSPELDKLILTNSISPRPLHKCLTLLEEIRRVGKPDVLRCLELALANGLVGGIGNLHFGPEVGVEKPKADAPAVAIWWENVQKITRDLRSVRGRDWTQSMVHHADARTASSHLKPRSITAIITSPPYPNEKDYSRTTRLESVLLGFIQSKEDLRKIKQGAIRSNTRGVYKLDSDDQWVSTNERIQEIARKIEERRLELGKDSGFERLYARVTKLYFGGMARHLAELKPLLKPGAWLAYVVGDQASYLRVMIRTGQILAEIAEGLGYKVESIDLFRTRLATATREQLREEVVVLRLPL